MQYSACITLTADEVDEVHEVHINLTKNDILLCQ